MRATTVWIVPEFCPGPLYGGWHLYTRQANKERASFERHGWGWLRDDSRLRTVGEALTGAGVPDVPAIGYGGNARSEAYGFVEWFVGRFPVGALVDATLNGDRVDEYGGNVREPGIEIAVPLAYHSAHGFVRAARGHGEAFVEGAPGHPQKNWTTHDWLCVLQDLETAIWFRELARALRDGAPRPSPLPPPYGWMTDGSPS